MDFGNDLIGCTFSKDYTCFFIYPIGIEFLCLDSFVQVSFVLWPIDIRFTIAKNITLFIR